eukprot:CAMPEP_0177581866 /NCGR_PEP_ID=MMETSP0419_2-20121207/2393_1 /TAXON_ID=582737 /ORGANISM="Tetraselmis sp., Strain GSL018" /LENGTH=337 /DNA_ID=CAMNT_0019070971 /DNA_START=149 /DNA_END=1163 /DNA_ORIENTATION=+
MKLDSHLHVWADKDQAASFPFPGGEPPYPGNAELLLDSMKESDVHGALIVQPANHKFDHSYVSSVLARYPGKFVGCLLADPTENGGGVDELDRLITQEGYRAVRFNPYLWPEDQSMANEVGRAMFKRAGELGAPVGFMTFKGLLNHVKDIEELCEAYPRTTVMLDHFGFCKCSAPDSEEWAALLSLARFPQVYVKVSAFFRVSDEPYPYMDARPMTAASSTVSEQTVCSGAQISRESRSSVGMQRRGGSLMTAIAKRPGTASCPAKRRRRYLGATSRAYFQEGGTDAAPKPSECLCTGPGSRPRGRGVVKKPCRAAATTFAEQIRAENPLPCPHHTV